MFYFLLMKAMPNLEMESRTRSQIRAYTYPDIFYRKGSHIASQSSGAKFMHNSQERAIKIPPVPSETGGMECSEFPSQPNRNPARRFRFGEEEGAYGYGVFAALTGPSNRLKAQRSGFEPERKKEGADMKFSRLLRNRENGMQRVSSDAVRRVSHPGRRRPHSRLRPPCARTYP